MKKMRFKLILVFTFLWILSLSAQENTYQKKVLESTEVDILMSYYEQDGKHSSVTGGEGTEELIDFTSKPSQLAAKVPIAYT